MKLSQRALQGLLRYTLLTSLAASAASPVLPQQPTPRTASDVPVILLSDVHFDPLHDPDKVALLDKASVSQWPAILDGPDSPGQTARFNALQQACNAKDGIDTPYALLRSSLSAAKQSAPSAAFVLVSGDLLVHDLDCRYRASLGIPASTKDDQSISAAFAEKTTVFVMSQLEAMFPQDPVYLSLGNNDSRCNHNRMDSHDAFLDASADALIGGLRGSSTEEKRLVSLTYRSAGYYAVTMPSPMTNTRLVVLDDVYMMPKFANCNADATDVAGSNEESVWLQKQLEDARSKQQRVWLLGHLPPAVNPDASLTPGSFCATGKAIRFQTSDDLADQIINNDDTIKLGIFGHTHMDEFHLLRGKNGGVPIKVVGSISPVDGNLPSFTVATVNPAQAGMDDFSVYIASNKTGAGTEWKLEYSFDGTYGVAGFSSASLKDLIERLHADSTGTTPASVAYREHFLKGSGGKKLSPSWQGYICSLNNPDAKSYAACVCESSVTAAGSK